MKKIYIFAGLLVICLAVWGQSAGFKFVWDDSYFIVSNPAIRDVSYLPKYFTDIKTMAGQGMHDRFVVFRPIRNISYLMDYKIAGLKPAWWHIENVILHALNAFLIYLIALAILRNAPMAFFAAALFAVHPAQSEAVCWVKCRDDLLSTFFTLLAFGLWLRWRAAGMNVIRLIAILAAYFLACLGKEQAVILPALILAYDYCRPDKKKPCNDTAITVFFMAVAGFLYIAWRHFYIGHSEQTGYIAGSFLPTMLTMLKAGCNYLLLLVYPAKLLADYSGMTAITSVYDWRVWAYAGILALYVLVALKCRAKWPAAFFAMAWIAICLLPVSNILPTFQYMAERFLYLPMAGFAVLAGSLAGTLKERVSSRAALIACIAVLCVCGVMSFSRARVWKDERALFTATVRDTPPGTLRPRLNLVYELIRSGRFDEAMPLAKKLWEENRDRPDVDARHKATFACNLGTVYFNTGDTGRAKDLFAAARAIDPTYSKPLIYEGALEGLSGGHAEALKYFDRAAAIDPWDPEAHFNKGIALASTGNKAGALGEFRKAIACGYPGPAPYKELVSALTGLGQNKEALAACVEASKGYPGDAWIKDMLIKLRAKDAKDINQGERK